MVEINAQPLPDFPIAVADLKFFHRLATQAVNGVEADKLLNQVADYLNLDAVMLYSPASAPPDFKRVVVIPLRVGTHVFGDLYASLPSQSDSAQIAAHLAFFAPVIALALAAKS